MTQSSTINRRIVLASRPAAAPTPANFRLEETAVPVPGAGQFLLRADYLSLDPYMRGRMSDAPSYSPPVEIGGVMTGGTVSRVVTSQHPDYQAGDLVMAYTGWQDYAVSDGTGVTRLDPAMAHPSYALGLFGMPGFTAYAGMRSDCAVQRCDAECCLDDRIAPQIADHPHSHAGLHHF